MRTAKRILLSLMLVALVCSLSGTPASGQSTGAGTVAGQVTDPSKAVIAGATVSLIDATTKSSRETKTNEAGRFIFVNVFPGSYDVKVSKEGFRDAIVSKQTVSVGLVTTIDVEMKVGTSAEIVEVKASGTALQTTNATVGSSMNFDIAQALPGLSRDVSGLAMLQPATTPVSGTAGVAGSVAGSNADQNMFILDGGNNSSDMDGTNTVYLNGFAGNPITGGGSAIPNGVVPTPIDSIEEFKVGVAGQGADFNAAAGNQVTMATRRGTNSIHGSASEYYYGTNFAANDWSNGHTPSGALPFTPLPSRHQNRFSASAGGPVLPFDFLGGKTYLFGFYQGVRFPNITTAEKAVPSALLRAGVIQVQNSGTGAVPVTVNGITYPVGAWVPYNLNPNAVTVNGVTYAPTNVCPSSPTNPAGSCDPRVVGLNPIVNQIWSQWMPVGNDTAFGDSQNTIGYKSTISLPQNDNNWVFRLDHDFGKKWRFTGSYRYYKLSYADTSQVDFGGIVNPGTQKGQFSALRTYPSYPSLLTGGLSTTITDHLYNDFHYSYTYNWWAWNGPGAPPQPIAGLGGAVEIGGESANALIPYNVNTQNARTRFWDGQDHMFRDDLSLLKRNHLFQFGGLYQRNFNWHDRNDNGQGTMAANVYQVVDSAGISWTGFLPPSSALFKGQQGNYQAWAAQVLGLVGQPQTLYTRAGADLHLLALGTHAQDKSIIPFYQLYWSDTWHMKPAFTLTYGLSYSLEMPPYEEAGKQVMLVGPAGNPIQMDDYFAQRQKAALAGQVYNPTLGFALVRNVAGGGRKYPYDPFYKGFSPRASAAWNPHFNSGILGSLFGNGKTVIRGGYSRIYGRLNGVNLVLVPLLGTGIMQGVACVGAVNAANAVAGNQCLGSGGATPATAFRIGTGIGTDGLVAPLGGTPSATLPQPYFPGVGGNLAAAPGSGLDPKTRPSVNDTFTLSIQREVSSKLFVEVGYIGKLIGNEFQEVNVDAIPWMTTLGGQTFANAYANMYKAICGLTVQICSPSGTASPQAFIEAALGGASSAFCNQLIPGTTNRFANCTAALIGTQGNLIASNRVYDLWNFMASSIATKDSWTLGRTNPGMNPPGGCLAGTPICRQFQAFEFDGSNGFGNYHGVYNTVTFRDWHGITARSNFTWGRSLGTNAEVQARSTRTVLNPWDLRSEYGPNGFDVKFIYNLAVNYSLPFFKSQHGVAGRLLGGWSVSPLFTAQSGFPLNVVQQDGSGTQTSREAFGQSDPSQSSIYNVVVTNGPFTGGNSLHYSTTPPAGSVGTSATSPGQWLNMFADPTAAYNQFRRFILGVDTGGGGFGILRGFPRWNLDMTIAKEVRATERVGLSFTAMTTNVLNHFQPADPSMNLNDPAHFGRVSAAQYDSRQIEFGVRVHF